MQLLNLILIFICLFSYTNLKCATGGYVSVSPSSCHNSEFSSSESKTYYKCCYVEASGKNIDTGAHVSITACVPITQYQYDNLEDLMDNDEFDCKSSYINVTLLLLSLIIFL